jgi:phosphatidylglycerol lysyltransferase
VTAVGTVRPSPRTRPWQTVRRCPLTVGTLVVTLAVGGATKSLVAGPSPALQQAVGTGVGRPLWSLLTSGLWAGGAASYLAVTGTILLLLAPAERQLGSRVALVGLLAGQVLGVAIGVSVIGALARAGDAWAQAISDTVVIGPFPGLLAVAGLATARAPALWRRRLRLLLTVILLALVLYSGTAPDVVRLSGWLLGLTAGGLLRRREHAPAAPHLSRREGRALVALVVAVTALGPLVAAVSRTPDGPWAVVSHLFVSGRPHHALLRAVCGPGGDPADCRVLEARARLTGHGPALLSVLPVVLQLVLAEGLRRGRRAAWVTAVVFSAALTTVGGLVVVTVLRTPAEALPMLDVRPGSLPTVSILAPLAAPLAVLVLLLLTRSRFGVRLAPGAVRRWLLTSAAGLAVVAAVYVAAGSLFGRQFARRPSVVDLLVDLSTRMLPPGYLGEFVPPLVPLHGGARLIADWAGVAAWTVLLATVLLLVRRTAPAGDALRARRLVERHGEGPLSFMVTWTGNRYWFPADGESVVGFRVIGGVAITTGDPVGAPAAREEAVRGFSAWCDEQGWTPCWYAVTDDVPRALAEREARRLQVAAETWLPLGELSFRGRRWQDVRTAINRARREGVQARWLTWSETPLGLRQQIVRLSEEWLAAKGLPEMGFTLGGLDELTDDAVRCLVAVDADGRVIGLTSWLPAHRDGHQVGWTLDVMRRAHDAGAGTVEFLIATAALTFQDEGAAWVSLSGAPLALPPGAADGGGLTRLLELAGRTMEPVYGFRSLLAFKAKFQPRYRPLWLVYPGTGDLPRIARAVSLAYLPHLSPVQAARLAGALVRGHRAADRPHPPGPVPGPAEPERLPVGSGSLHR